VSPRPSLDPVLVAWVGEDGMRYEVRDLGDAFHLAAAGNVRRTRQGPLTDILRAEWLTLHDRGRTEWAERLLIQAEVWRD
jgi:hypothetical protein